MEHISALSNGLNQDSDPSVQPAGTYRKGRNGTLISKDNNHYSFESLDGTVLNWTMPLHHQTPSLQTKFVPIGWFRMGDKLVVHSADVKTAVGGDGEIGIVSFDNSGNGTYEALYYHAELYYTQAKMIAGYGLEENEIYHRAYWTDNLNQPRTINVILPQLLADFNNPVTPLVVGVQYMVLTNSTGRIEHPVGSGNFYGPKQTLGNVFTATTTTFTPFGIPKVIKYFDVNLLNYTPGKQLGTIDFVEYEFGGALWCGVKMYAYRLTTNDGYESSWSYLTNPIHVGPSDPSAGYQDYQGAGSDTTLVNSTKYITLQINDIPLYFDNIEVAVVEVDQKMDIVRNIEVFWMSAITGASMTIFRYGQENLKKVLLEDLGLNNAFILKCKDMTTLKQRQIIANLTEREELDWTPTAATVTPHIYTLPVDDYPLATDNTIPPEPHPMQFRTLVQPEAGVAAGNILPGGHYVVKGGTGTITYGSVPVVYTQGQTFIGEDNVLTFVATLSANKTTGQKKL